MATLYPDGKGGYTPINPAIANAKANALNNSMGTGSLFNYSALNQPSPYSVMRRSGVAPSGFMGVNQRPSSIASSGQPINYRNMNQAENLFQGVPKQTRTGAVDTPPNWRKNLLNYIVSPKGQGMAQGLLEGSGYSKVPRTLGEIVALGMQRGNQAEATAAASKLKTDEFAYKKEQDKISNALELQKILAGVAQGTTDTAKIKDFKFYKNLSKDGKAIWDKLIKENPENALLMALAQQAGSQGQTGGVTLSPLDVAYDKAFATKAVEWETLGFAETESNLDKLQTNIEKLKTQDDLTGWFIGLMPDKIKAAFNPEALALKNDIESIIFQSLKETLGAQFTEREGRMLVAANFNEMLPEEVNLKRMQRLYDTTMKASKAKEDKIAYFRENGTIKGWEGQVFTFEDIASSLVGKNDYKNLSQKELEKLYLNPDLNDYEAQLIEGLLKDMED
jgi:DNA-binding protein H-NS|tara:strand:- start:1548 stop:2894 length:1347 start_codon:yes stop_codon:yes gene_type:complete